MNLIETQNLSHRYWRHEALRDLNLTVPTGSVTALLGANGAGKTTTIKILMNLLRPSGGVARVLGVDSRRLGERDLARIGYVSENQQLPEWMTVTQLLNYCRPFYPGWDRALEAKLLAQFVLPPDRKLKHLSRGMKMKAALVSVLAYRPELLVLDEPFSGLDPVVRDDVTRGLLEAAQLGEWTVLVSSHDIEEVERLADRIAFIEDGSLRFAETTETLLGRFRRMEIEAEGRLDPRMPATWLGWESRAGRATFVDSAYDRVAAERMSRELFPEATVRAHPMTLREIFLALARAKQVSTGGETK